MGGISRRYFCGLAAGLASIPADFSSNSAAAASARTVRLGDGTLVPALGQGSWHLGQMRHPIEAEEEAMRVGISLGLTLIDTAEAYGDGLAEEMIGRVITGQRDHVFIVSKVLPSHADPAGIRRACEGSLGRLGTDHLDLYLLHWRDGIRDLSPVVSTFEELKAAGRIRRWGVSNFRVGDMEDLLRVPAGYRCAINQVEYSLANRRIERDLASFATPDWPTSPPPRGCRRPRSRWPGRCAAALRFRFRSPVPASTSSRMPPRSAWNCRSRTSKRWIEPFPHNGFSAAPPAPH